MRRIFAYIAASVLLLTSCDAWLDVKPYDKMSQDELLSDEEGFIKLLNGIYIELNSAPRRPGRRTSVPSRL